MPHFSRKRCNFEHWKRLDSWGIEQAAFILLSYEPPSLDYLIAPHDPFDLYNHNATYDKPNGYDKERHQAAGKTV